MATLEAIADAIKDANDALEKRTKAFDEFKKNIEQRFNALEDREAKSNRPKFGGSGEDSQLDSEHKSAFRQYITKGNESGLIDLQGKSLSIGSGTDGGYAVPKVIDGMIDAIAVNISPIRAIAQVVQTSTSDFHKLINIRGTSSGWVGETAARTETNSSQLVDIAPPMGELYAMPTATQQMLDDVFFNAEQWIAQEVATEFARAEGAAFVSGTGVNQPKGFLAGPTAATGDSSRAFGTIEHVATGVSGDFKALTSTVNPVDDLFTLVSKLKAAYRPGACWLMPKSVLYKIMAMKDYQGRYVFSPAVAPGMQDTILGYPVYEAEDMPALAANSLSVAFGNFKLGYLIVDRVGTRVIRDPFSNKPRVNFYVTKRTGGALLNSEAIKVLKFA
jgi:HK97 family phage major capsid protein